VYETRDERRAPESAFDASRVREGAVSDRDFARFQALIHREAGIFLAPAKKALLVTRLRRRLRELGIPSLRRYYDRVVEDAEERVRMLDAICTNETRFFREPRHFDFLADRVFPAWREAAARGRRPQRLRVWSAACSTGEEPYSIAMALRSAFPLGWDLEVLATDLSTRVLEQARRGVWPIRKAEEIPRHHLRAFMLRGRGADEGIMKAGPELREIVRFARVNLVGDSWPVGPPFDLLLCRNVLIYFDVATKVRVVERLIDRVAEGGFLLLGHAESLGGLTQKARALMPTVYAPLPELRRSP
jgi:chemotaxis protein methyltransferase CheR